MKKKKRYILFMFLFLLLSYFIWEYYCLSVNIECKSHWGTLGYCVHTSYQYSKHPFFTGEDIVGLINLKDEIAGTPQKISIFYATVKDFDERLVPFFWEKKPYHFNSYLIVDKHGREYRIPRKIWEEYLNKPTERYEKFFYRYEKRYGGSLDVLKHILWKYFGYNFEWNPETTKELLEIKNKK